MRVMHFVIFVWSWLGFDDRPYPPGNITFIKLFRVMKVLQDHIVEACPGDFSGWKNMASQKFLSSKNRCVFCFRWIASDCNFLFVFAYFKSLQSNKMLSWIQVDLWHVWASILSESLLTKQLKTGSPHCRSVNQTLSCLNEKFRAKMG